MKRRSLLILIGILVAAAASWMWFQRAPAPASSSGVEIGRTTGGVDQRDLNVLVIIIGVLRLMLGGGIL